MDKNTYIPENFIEDVKTYLPEHLNLDDFIEHCQKPLRLSIRVNTLKMSVDDFKLEAKVLGWQITPVPWCPEGFWISRSEEEQANLPIGNTALHLSGCIYVQEASSMLPPLALRSEIENMDTDQYAVLDMAAAPGSKTSQLCALMNNQGLLVANEFSSSRLKVLAANMKRMGAANCALSHFDGKIFGDYMYECFDHIQLDAPCSGEGTVRKDANALKNWSIESNIDISDVQKSLIKSAFLALKPGGSLVYSTCTLTPLENQQVCSFLLEEFAGALEVTPLDDLFDNASQATTSEGYLHVWPQIFDSEGFFIAKFKKLASVEHPNQQQKKGAFPFEAFPAKAHNTFASYLKKQFKIKQLPGTLMQRDKELWLFPEKLADVQNKIKYARLGIKVGAIHKNGVRLEHELATAFGHLATENVHALTEKQAVDYFQGKDVRLEKPTNETGEVILTLCGAPVGLGKWQKAKIKNNLPRDLIAQGQLITWV
ncbi:16S rRNA (cytosine(1407)-C(5))-methyltransferase RsmF [Pseudoalteromonas luteoviolacea]|uniref:16S rRNA (cytosine(1407)-C(5))-methyltransferase RsmF n=1 Tax=Pseudoalteromonas luteoviolacea TaxID=43657 RepID=UPI001B3A53BF|nr:16S rRNA (cytosine(1407)-C(5))-methyltransferase RsmF [Pseudoalteromonas luteoviolacea]MBQ4879427.1 16S rRNA (cytosine(1407)-C(5))-methyltransferase RsmF [Pseudoalteromonas luteoviolacea]MBQ4908487.1 16S rRNA (cytosine(1407)-C(5))-methyltransferase RsmF [Pseudoalteromonas luteoviolacea]